MRPSFNNEYGGSFVLIEPGSNCGIKINEPFFVSARPVTQVEWTSIMETNPSKFSDGWSAGLRPVENISWHDCNEYISRLNEVDNETKLGLTGKYRLPDKLEWEYFCRAGTDTKWYHSNKDNEVDTVAWHAGNSGATTREVGQKQANNWGLFDLHGNVAEWTSSESDGKYITKGGSWLTESESTQVSSYRLFSPDKKSDSIGFRVIWVPF